MPGAQFEAAGAQPRNQSRGKPIHVARMETGLFTNRSALHDTATFVVSKFYGGYVDALIDGVNMEVTNQLTLARRPGLSKWSTIPVPDHINWFYDWSTLDFGIKVVVDTTTSTYIQSATTQQKIFTKTNAPSQGFYVGVADTLFYGDGVDLQFFTLPTGQTFNWGFLGGTTAPGVTITQTASATVQWAPGVIYSTMGLVIDSNNNIQQLISVNANPTISPNSSQIGISGNGQPVWNNNIPGTTPDNGFLWSNWGPIVAWTQNTLYNNASNGGTLANPCIIFDPATSCCFIIANPGGVQGMSGATRPNFPAGFGQSVFDSFGGVFPANAKWFNLGSLKTPQTWRPGHVYPTLGSVPNDDSVVGIVEPTSLALGLPASPAIEYWQVNNTGGNLTSAASGTNPPWATGLGLPTTDNQLGWLNLGSRTRLTSHNYIAWSVMGAQFSVIVDTNGNFQVCTMGGLSSNTATASIPWATGYGQTTPDGTGSPVVWTCVGPSMPWTANTKWYLPTTGWFPPSGAASFGGALITDTNGDVQATIASGLSQTPGPPTWPAFGSAVGTTTADPSPFVSSTPTTVGSVLWRLVGAFTAAGFSFTKSLQYEYSYKSRTANDIFNTTIPPDWFAPLGPPTGSQSGQVSNPSPAFIVSGGNPGAVVTLKIPRSPDPAVDTIVIWRTLDGGSTFFFLTEVPNPPPGTPFQTVTDVSPDSVINQFIAAPIGLANSPPPAGFLPMAFHFQRIWGAVGNFVFASGGPDVVTGNPNESFDPLDFFEFPSPVTRIVPTAVGILVFLTNSIYAILGGPIFSTFFGTPMVPGIGLLHYNALDIHGGQIYMFTADSQLISLDPSGGAQRMGGPIADKLAFFDPKLAFVTVHESGNDNAVFVADGVSGWYRLNPVQFPNNTAVWSPFAAIENGAGAVLSIETTKGVHNLLVASSTATPSSPTFILKRDFSTYADDGLVYPCFFTMGSINVVNPGQIAGLTFVNLRATRVGTTPGCSFLLNEISGPFITFPDAQPYPWQIYGATGQSTSLFSNAYYFRHTGVPALAEHLQVKVTFPEENFPNEVLSLTIFGTIEMPPEV